MGIRSYRDWMDRHPYTVPWDMYHPYPYDRMVEWVKRVKWGLMLRKVRKQPDLIEWDRTKPISIRVKRNGAKVIEEIFVGKTHCISFWSEYERRMPEKVVYEGDPVPIDKLGKVTLFTKNNHLAARALHFITSPAFIRRMKRKGLSGYLAFTRNAILIRYARQNGWLDFSHESEDLRVLKWLYWKRSRRALKMDDTSRRRKYANDELIPFFFDFNHFQELRREWGIYTTSDGEQLRRPLEEIKELAHLEKKWRDERKASENE